jgi:hypothetical protein
MRTSCVLLFTTLKDELLLYEIGWNLDVNDLRAIIEYGIWNQVGS